VRERPVTLPSSARVVARPALIKDKTSPGDATTEGIHTDMPLIQAPSCPEAGFAVPASFSLCASQIPKYVLP
jgi:hypothetical protein